MTVRWFVVLSLVVTLTVGLIPPVGAQSRVPDPVYGLLQLQPAPGCDHSCVATLTARLRAVAADTRCTAACQADVRRGLDFLRTYRQAPNKHIQDVKARLRSQRRGFLEGFVRASEHFGEVNSCNLACLEILNAERQQAAVAALQFNACLCDSPEARSAYRGYLEASYVVGHDEAMRLMGGVYNEALGGDYEAVSYPGQRIIDRATPWLRDRVRDMYMFSVPTVTSAWIAARIAGMTYEQMRGEAARLGRLNPLYVAEYVAYLALLLDARFFGFEVWREVMSLFTDRLEKDN